MVIVQCWDDGVTTDIRLVDIFRRNDAKATFNLNAGLYGKNRQAGWIFKGKEIVRLGWNEMRAVYEGFTIANHSLTHPFLDQMPEHEARRDILEGRERLQQFFDQPVFGFAYPFGLYNHAVMNLIRETGHIYARTTTSADYRFPPEDPMSFHPSCHFLATDFWSRYQQAKKDGVFYFWGHSYEMTTEAMWITFEETIKRISGDTESCWGVTADLFTPQ